MGYHILDYDIELEIKKFQKSHQINILKVEMQDKNNYGKKRTYKKNYYFCNRYYHRYVNTQFFDW